MCTQDYFIVPANKTEFFAVQKQPWLCDTENYGV